MNVRLIAKTTGYSSEYENRSLDEITVGIARLSSSREINELFSEPDKLLRHCIINQHWSVFTTTNLVFEIETSRAIGREILRHWTLRPQELSQRYASITSYEEPEMRVQATNNRQSSVEVINSFDDEVKASIKNTFDLYNKLINNKVSRETARMILPECSTTKIIFNGTLREWITTLNLRLHKTAQKEVRLISEAIKNLFIKECPIISSALFNFEDAYEIHILERVILERYGVYKLIKDNGFKRFKTTEN